MLNNKVYQAISILIVSNVLIGCAQFVPPTGGKKDEVAPKLIKSIPENKKTNFTGKEIELYFDELVDVTALRQELIIIPEIEGYYNIKPKSNGIILKFDQAFKENTTYTLNFKKGVKDLNEKNEVQNLKLAFSTGPKIDSLQVEGNVKNLFTNEPALEAHVALYQVQDTLSLKKTKPNYFVKTDSSGNYKFENIKAGKYRLYAFTDKNNNLRFDSKTETIAFIKDTIKLDKNITNMNMALYGANNEKPKNVKTLQRAEDYTVIYDKNIKNFKVEFVNIIDSIPVYGYGKELRFYNIPLKTDTIKVNITVADSADNVFTHLQKIKFRDAERKKKLSREFISFQIDPRAGQDVEKQLKYELTFETPISRVDYPKIKILSDTITNEPLKESNFTWNNYKTVLTINKEVGAQREVKVEFDKGAFINIKGDSSDNLIIKNKIGLPENYGIIEGTIEGGKENKIVQLVDENYRIHKQMQTKDRFLFKNVRPGAYLVRTIVDANNNGQWDYGNVEKDILPEQVFFSEEVIRIKANFELRDIKIPLK